MKLSPFVLWISAALVSQFALADQSALVPLGEHVKNQLYKMQHLANDPSNVVIGKEERRYLQYQGKQYWLNHENFPKFPLFNTNGEYNTAFPFVNEDWEWISYNGGFYLQHKELGVMNLDDSGCFVEYIPAARGSQRPDGSYAWKNEMVMRTVTSGCGDLSVPEVTELKAASVSDVGVQLVWNNPTDAEYKIALTSRPQGEPPITVNYTATGPNFYIAHLTPETQYEVELTSCNILDCDSQSMTFTTLPVRLAYNDTRQADNHLSGNLSAHVNFAQTHTSVTPNTNTENRRPELVMSRNALLLITPQAYSTNHLWLEILQDGVVVDKVAMNPPTAQPATDQVAADRSTVVFSHHAWSTPINWRWMQPGLSLRLTDNFGRIGELAETDLTFGGAPELVINNIDIGMLTPPRNQYSMIKEMHKLAPDYFQKIPASKLVMVDYTPLHLTKVTLPNGKVYTERSDDKGGVYVGDMRGAIGKALISMGINNANFGIPDSAGITGTYARRTNIITSHNSIGAYTNGIVTHGLSGGGGMVTLRNSTGNEWSHELAHNFGRGHHPHLASIHDETTGWGWDALYNRFIGNMLWKGEVKTMEWAGQIVPPFAGEFTFTNDSQAGGNTAFNGPISSYTHDHPAGTLKTQQWLNSSQRIDTLSPTGYSRWNQAQQRTVAADVNFTPPIAAGVPVATILGIYDPTGKYPSQVYPLTYSNYGHVFDLPAPELYNHDILQGWQDISTLSQADRLNTEWQTIRIDDQQQLLCQYQTNDQFSNRVTLIGYENGNVCQTSDDMKWRFDNAWRKISTSETDQYQLLSSFSAASGPVTYQPTPELGERELCSLATVGGSHDGAGYVEDGKCRQLDGIKHTNNAIWSYGLKPNNSKVHVFKASRQCQVDIEFENGTTQSIAVHGDRYDLTQSNKFHINVALDNPPSFVSVSCQQLNGEKKQLDALEVDYNPAIEALVGPVIIGQEFGYQASELTIPSGWFNAPEGFDHSQLSKVEQASLATLRKGDDKPYLCRFPMSINESTKIVYGFVEQQSEGGYKCTGGSEITVRDSHGERPMLSELNQFEWLSLSNREQIGELVKAKSGSDANLCSLNQPGTLYGVGFVNQSGQCVQESEVYWSNGRRWVFSNGYVQYSYR